MVQRQLRRNEKADCDARKSRMSRQIYRYGDGFEKLLSYPRHEYFRRILCEYIGDLVEEGKYPRDMEFLKNIAEDISYNNAAAYFGI